MAQIPFFGVLVILVGCLPVGAAAASSDADSDFQGRCSQPGVIKCVGFDSPGDFRAIGGGRTHGGIQPPYGTTDLTRAVRDTSVKASGAGSLRFEIPSNTAADSSGSYSTNFADDLSVQFGANSEFYVQWRQRFSPELLHTRYEGGQGWKQLIVGTGDKPGKGAHSCSDLEVVVNSFYQAGFPIVYHSCSGSASHGPYDGFQEPYGPADFKLQNARPQPFCLYSGSRSSFFPPVGNCFGYFANEWMTFQLGIKTGRRVGNEFVGSHVWLWIAREGRPSEAVFDWGPYNLSAGDPGEDQKYGKVWLTPYHTGKSAKQAHPTAYTWYDELIISRNRIPDPR